MFARRTKFIMRLNPQADWGIGHRNVWRIGEDRTDRNDGGTIVILPIPNDIAVFGLSGEASARLVSEENVCMPNCERRVSGRVLLYISGEFGNTIPVASRPSAHRAKHVCRLLDVDRS